jgi:hypothetical protein
MPTARRGRHSIDIAAPPELVYDLIADVTRTGEWSPAGPPQGSTDARNH